jgi:hypothetical protein
MEPLARLAKKRKKKKLALDKARFKAIVLRLRERFWGF